MKTEDQIFEERLAGVSHRERNFFLFLLALVTFLSC